jgi:hypothetical protein
VLNRHAIVLFLGIPAMVLLSAIPETAYGSSLAAFVVVLIGLLLDTGQPASFRTVVAHGLQATGVVLLSYDAMMALSAKAFHLAFAEAGIGLAVAGVLAEMRLGYARLRLGVALQLLGDLVFLGGAAFAFTLRNQSPSTIGWVFIGIAGGLAIYAALSNFGLQLARLRDPQAGWRYRVLELEPAGLRLKTPGAEARIGWSEIEAVTRLDGRHLLLVLPAPLPGSLKASGLPFEELRANAEAPIPELAPPPEKYGFVLLEQELGRPLGEAEALLGQQLRAWTA